MDRYERTHCRVESLLMLARKACIRRVEFIEDVGDLEYRLVRPILIKLQNPAVLRVIEENSPQIAEEDEELWKNFIKRDFGQEGLDKYKPKDHRLWHKVYRKLKRENAEKDKADKELLKSQMEALKAQKDSKRTTILTDLRRSEAMQTKRASLPAAHRGPWGRDIYHGSSSSGGSGSGDALRGVRPHSGIFKSAKLSKILTRKH